MIRSERWRRVNGLMALAACGAIILAGCSSSASPNTHVAPTAQTSRSGKPVSVPDINAPTALPVTSLLPRRPPTGKEVVFLNSGVPPDQLFSEGLAAASKVLQWSYSSVSYSQANPATFISAFESAIQNGANVIVVSATSSSEYQQVLPAARAKGVLVIDQASSNSALPGVTALIDNSAANAGLWGTALAAETLANARGAAVHAAIVTAPLFATILQQTNTAYENALMRKCRHCTVGTIAIPAGDVLTGGDAKDVISYLQIHPDTNYLFFATSLLDVGTRSALSAAGMSAVKIIGQNALSPQVTELQNGQATAWLDEPLVVDGWMALDAAARAMTGGGASAYNDAPEPVWMLTADRKPSGTSLPEVPLNYQDKFKRMWHIGG